MEVSEPPGEPQKHKEAVAKLLQNSPSFMLLDFQRLNGFDASSSQAFCGLKRKLGALGVKLVICGIPSPYIQRLLISIGVIATDEGRAIQDGAVLDTLDSGLVDCENKILKVWRDPQAPEGIGQAFGIPQGRKGGPGRSSNRPWLPLCPPEA